VSVQPESKASETLAAWQHSLAEIAHLGDLMCAAIDRDDLLTAIATMMQLRRARTDIARIDASVQGIELVDPVAIETARAAVARSQSVDAIMTSWISRPLPPDADLLQVPLGVAIVADAMLPAAWDFERDVAILVGNELADVAQILVDLGQQRVIFLGDAPVASSVVTVKSAEELGSAMRTMTPMAPHQVALRAAVDSDEELLEKCSAMARDSLADLRVHQNTVATFSRTWIDQGTTNLPAISRWPTVDAVGDRFAGKPMVIVAPGPSLAKNIHQLRELQGKVVICCFSHSLKPVIAAGITPDVIVTADPQDVRYHFANMDTSQSFLVSAATVHPSLFELPARGMFSMAANGPIDDWLYGMLGESTPELIGGGSVATSAYALAMRWKCEPVVFLGLDLSFPNGKYYVATSSDGDARAEVASDGTMKVAGWSAGFHAMKSRGGPEAARERTIELPGWSGGTVPSSFMFGLFRRWFIDAMRVNSEVDVYNCTEGGCHIDGMEHVPFETLKASLTTSVDARAMLDDAIGSVDSRARIRAAARGLSERITHLRRARQLARRAIDMIVSGASDRELRRVERILADVLRPIELVSLVAQREIDRAITIASHDGDEASYLAASKALFDALVRVVDELLPVITRAHARMVPA
jgi:hypothetical protein